MDVGVVADRVGVDPAGVHVGEVHGARELALQARSAVGHRVDLEEPGLGLDLVTGLADGDRVTQQIAWFGGALAADRIGGFGGGEVAVDRGRRHRLQLRPHRGAVAVEAGHQ